MAKKSNLECLTDHYFPLHMKSLIWQTELASFIQGVSFAICFWKYPILPSVYLLYKQWRHSGHQKYLQVPYFNIDKETTDITSLGHLYSHCWWHLVVLYTHHHFILHGKPGSLPYSRTDDYSHWKCWRLGRTNWDFIWNTGQWINYDILQGKPYKTRLYFNLKFVLYFGHTFVFRLKEIP